RIGNGRTRFFSRPALRRDQILVGNELMTVLLENGARKIAPANYQDFLVVLLEFFNERDEIAIPSDDHESIDVIPRKCHLERVQSEIDVGAVLIASRRQIALYHLNRVLSHASAVFAGAFPIPIRDFCNDLAAFLDGFKDGPDIKMAIQGAFDPDLDVVKVDKYGDF